MVAAGVDEQPAEAVAGKLSPVQHAADDLGLATAWSMPAALSI
jgi:hypothetical protein